MSRGLLDITLYENDSNLFIRYEDEINIGQIQTTGRSYSFDSCYFPKYEKTINRVNGRRLYEREIILQLRERSELSNWLALLNSYYGWVALINFDNLRKKIVLDPLLVERTNENYQQGINYELKLSHYVDSAMDDISYGAVDFLTVDTTEITVDSDLITADQNIYL